MSDMGANPNKGAPTGGGQTASLTQWLTASKEEVPDLTTEELEGCLAVLSQVFECVRVLDTDRLVLCSSDMTARGRGLPALCCGVWGRVEQCSNCTSARAMAKKGIAAKFEVLEDDVCLVISRYVLVGGSPRVVEMLSRVGSAELHGFEGNPTLINAINEGHSEVYHDVQLGIYNRRYYEEQLPLVKGITAVAMLDVDDFKRVNDTWGHAAGDEVLASVAGTAKNLVRKGDFVIRYGGDEMLVVFVGIPCEHFAERLETIRVSVERLVFEDFPDLHVTVSIGGCFCEEAFGDSVERADRQLYFAKQTKNSISLEL